MVLELSGDQVLEVLAEVKDPEIPTLSIVDLGMVEGIEVFEEQEALTVTLIPTFLGCPALDLIRVRVRSALAQAFGLAEGQCRVEFSLKRAWTSQRLTDKGRARLGDFGMAPPPRGASVADFVEGSATVVCPLCHSPQTDLQNLFGSAACRALYYCKSCRNPFEVMKPI